MGGPRAIRPRSPSTRASAWRDPPTCVGYAYQLYAAAGWTSLPWLHRIAAPTLVVAGDDDPSVPVGNARMLAARLPNARVRVLEGGGHLFLLDEPENAIAPILSFLDADL